jgi:hypothetical protein
MTTAAYGDRAGYAPPAGGAAVPATTGHRQAYIAVFAAVCVMVGVYWDLSWHMSIGRDTVWTPAHLLIQAGGLIAGGSAAYIALHTTFRGTQAERDASVSFWGFRAPLGAWISIWGCGAMLTSAPFDNWWHNAYGLDVKIVSPPHVVLAVGIFSIAVGALLLTLAEQNRASESDRRRLAWMLALIGGLVLMNLAVFLTEYSERPWLHSAVFYEITGAVFPLALTTLARAIKLRWAATASAAFFTGIMLALMWIIQLFPATPKLGPIYQPVTHMLALSFPLLIIVPAIGIDIVLQHLDSRVSTPVLAVATGVVFVALFVAAEWPFASFLVFNPAARGAFFNANNFVYFESPSRTAAAHHFVRPAPGALPLPVSLLIAAGIASVASWLGLLRGEWMRRVRR